MAGHKCKAWQSLACLVEQHQLAAGSEAPVLVLLLPDPQEHSAASVGQGGGVAPRAGVSIPGQCTRGWHVGSCGCPLQPLLPFLICECCQSVPIPKLLLMSGTQRATMQGLSGATLLMEEGRKKIQLEV